MSAAAASASRAAPSASSSFRACRARSIATCGRTGRAGRAPARAGRARPRAGARAGEPVDRLLQELRRASRRRPPRPRGRGRGRRSPRRGPARTCGRSPRARLRPRARSATSPSASLAWTRRSSSGAASRFVAPELVELRSRSALAACGLAAGQAQGDGRLDRLWLVLEAGEELLRLVEPSLQDADLGQPRGRLHAARPLAGLGQLAQAATSSSSAASTRPLGGEDVGAAGAAEREQRDVVVAPRRTPRRPGSTAAAARRRRRARTRASACSRRRRTSRGGRLAAGRGRHRLVQAGEAVVDLAGATPRRGRAGRARAARGRCRRASRATSSGSAASRADRRGLAGPLRAGEGEPSVLGARARRREQPLGAREPAARRRVVSADERVLAREPERDPRRPRQLAVAAEARVRPLPVDDRLALLAQPPQRAAEPVERLGRLRDRGARTRTPRAPPPSRRSRAPRSLSTGFPQHRQPQCSRRVSMTGQGQKARAR